MTISQFFAISAGGDVILLRNLRGEHNSGDPETFFKHQSESLANRPPMFQQNGVLYFYIHRSGLFFVATSLYKMPPSYVLELLQRITQVYKDFFGSLSEDSLRRNLALAYELLDEMLDFGYPQCTNIAELKTKVYNIPAPPQLYKLEHLRHQTMRTRATAPSYTSQRPISHASKNEVFVDVLERLSVILGPNGTVSNATIDGQIQIKSYLHNSPRIQLALNETIAIGRHAKRLGIPNLDFCTFDECVDVSQFDKMKIIEIAPPQGEFTAMTYRVQHNVRLPFKIVPALDIGPQSTRLSIVLVSSMPHGLCGNVKLVCALPASVKSVDLGGPFAGKYLPQQRQLKWDVIRLAGGCEARVFATIHHQQPKTDAQLSVQPNKRDFGPINLSFELPMYCASNLQVRYLRVMQQLMSTSVPTYRWVRYVTSSNAYTFRFN